MVDHWFAAPKEPFSGADSPSNRVIRRAAFASSFAAKKLSPYRAGLVGFATAAVVAPDEDLMGPIARALGLETFIKNKTPQPLSVGHRARVSVPGSPAERHAGVGFGWCAAKPVQLAAATLHAWSLRR